MPRTYKRKRQKPKTKNQQFNALALEEARRRFQLAIDWIDRKDMTWALVNARQGMDILNVVRNT